MSKEIRDLLEKSKGKHPEDFIKEGTIFDGWKRYCGFLQSVIFQALNLLKQQPTALNSCPYPPCKGEGKLQQNAGIYYVYCKNCGRHKDSFETEANAIKAWNNVNESEQPKAGEFTKKWRHTITGGDPDISGKLTQISGDKMLEACDIIDQLQVEQPKSDQALIEIADSSAKIGIIIEDGRIKKKE